jgi:hypothetical protein
MKTATSFFYNYHVTYLIIFHATVLNQVVSIIKMATHEKSISNNFKYDYCSRFLQKRERN